MMHLIWIIPIYVLVGFWIARFCMKFAGVDAGDAASILLAWPLFIPFGIILGIHEGIRRVLVKMEEKSHDDR